MQIDVQTLHEVVRDQGALHVFGAVYEELLANPRRYDDAERGDRVRPFLESLVRDVSRKNPDSRVLPQIFTDPTQSELQRPAYEFAVGDPDAALLAPQILEAAQETATQKMASYLGWLRKSHEGISDEEIAAAQGVEAVTIRGGRKRAVDYLLEVAHRMRHPAMRVVGELPEALAAIAAALSEKDTETAEGLLAQTQREFSEDPRWWNLAGAHAWRLSRWDDAVRSYREALVLADEPTLRAKILNNLGAISLSRDEFDLAQAQFLRASRIAPTGVPIWLNLLSVASLRRDIHDCRFYATRLVKVLRGRDSSASERSYAAERLRTNPNYEWLKQTSAWSGIARWLRSSKAPRVAGVASPLRALATMALIGLCMLMMACGHAESGPDALEAMEQDLTRVDETQEDPDGDVWIRPHDPQQLELGYLVEAETRKSDWAGADLSGADFSGADLTGSILWGANVTGTNFAGADLRKSDLSDIDWNNTTCPDGSNSDDNDGTCLGHLDPSDLVIIGK